MVRNKQQMPTPPPAVRVDRRLSSLFLPTPAAVRERLEQQLATAKHGGVLRVWAGHNIVLSDLDRLEVCRRRELPFRVEEVELLDLTAALRWVIQDQLGRTGLAANAAGYLRGRRYRLELQAADLLDAGYLRPAAFFRPAVGLPPLGRTDRGWKVADPLAEEYGVGVLQLRDDCYFSAAVDNIIASCGREGRAFWDEARRLLLTDHARLPANVILSIARTAPARQRYALSQVGRGLNPQKKPPDDLHVFDTTDFGEVTSRLRRAGGSLAEALQLLGRLPVRLRPELAARSTALAARLVQGQRYSCELRRHIEQAAVRKPDQTREKKQSARRGGVTGTQSLPAWEADSWPRLGVGCAVAFLSKTVRGFDDPPWEEMVHMSVTQQKKLLSYAWLDRIDQTVERLGSLLSAAGQQARQPDRIR